VTPSRPGASCGAGAGGARVGVAGACGGGAGGGRYRGGAGGARPAAPRPSCRGASCEQGAWSVVFELVRALASSASISSGHEKRKKGAQLLRFELCL